jgi:CRP/FNR family cyclic AMP-dependent transcriptional regulator
VSQQDRAEDRLDWPSGTLLGRLPEQARGSLLTLGTQLDVAPSEPILREGERGSHLVLLQRAIAKVTVNMADGRQALLSIRVSGDVVGEMSALNGTPRSATVTACGPATIRVIHRPEWQPFFRHHPEAALAIAGNMAARFQWANERRVDFASYPAKVRLARILIELSQVHGRLASAGRTIGVDLTQPEIATLCGAAEPTVEKSLRELREAGLVDTGYRHIVIRDLVGLRRFAHLEPAPTFPRSA